MNYDGYESGRGWSESAFGTFTEEQASYFDAELHAIGLAAAGGLRVLDIGYGNGSFLGWCRSRGWQCDGLELNSRLLERAAANGYACAADMDALRLNGGATSYDLITGFDVLEHIERASLVQFIAGLSGMCSSKTLLLFRFPNGDNPFSLPLQNGDITHLTAIGQFMIRQVVALAGFEVVYLGGPALPRSRITWHRRLLQVTLKAMRALVGRCIRYLFMGGLPVIFTPNLVAVVRLPESAGPVAGSLVE